MALISPYTHIAIALCTYQAGRFLALQMDSIIAQSHRDFSLHIFDDCSNDSTLAIISHYMQAHANIYLHINASRLGFVRNFEQAITALSPSERYIALCDQDDVWRDDKLTFSLSALQSLEKKHPNKPALVHSDLRMMDTAGYCLQESFFDHKQLALPKEKSLAKILGYNGVMGNTVLMNRQLAQLALPFPAVLKYHDYWLALVNEAFGVRATLSHQLVDYRIHEANASDNRANQPIKKKRQHLPFMADNRSETLSYLLNHYELENKDREIIQVFCDYLNLSRGKFETIMLLHKYDFLRKRWRYRLRVFRQLILST